jgi:hypothetical protein
MGQQRRYFPGNRTVEAGNRAVDEKKPTASTMV